MADSPANGTRSYHYVIHFETVNIITEGTTPRDVEFVYDHLPDQAEIERSVENEIKYKGWFMLEPGTIEFRSVAVIDS